MIEKPRIHKFLVWRNVKLYEIDREIDRIVHRQSGARPHDDVWNQLPAFGFRCFRDGDLFLIIKADAYGRLEEILLAKEVDVPVDEAARMGILSEEEARSIMLNHLYGLLNQILEEIHEDREDRENPSDHQD